MKIVFLNGPPRSGKDTAAVFLQENWGFKHLKFAKTLKQATHVLFGLSDIDIDHFEASKDEPTPLFHGKTPREAYISLSEHYIKPVYGNDFWGKAALQEIQRSKADCIVFSDCGFKKEIEPIIEHYGAKACLLIYLFRKGTNFNFDSRTYIKPPADIWHMKITNDLAKSDLYKSLNNALNYWVKHA